jgi:hypothetical protein
MTSRAQAQYLRIFDDSGTYLRWQGYYINQTVTWNTASWVYHPFTANGIVSGAGSGNDITVEVPATNQAVAAFTTALNNNRLCEIEIYEFDSIIGQSAPPASQTLIGSVTGEVVRVGGSFVNWTITIGSSLAPVGAQVPPRKFTNLLIGSPMKL